MSEDDRKMEPEVVHDEEGGLRGNRFGYASRVNNDPVTGDKAPGMP